MSSVDLEGEIKRLEAIVFHFHRPLHEPKNLKKLDHLFANFATTNFFPQVERVTLFRALGTAGHYLSFLTLIENLLPNLLRYYLHLPHHPLTLLCPPHLNLPHL